MSSIHDHAPQEWVKSTYSGNGGGNCLEWAPSSAASGLVPVRDSKVPEGPVLGLSDSAWGVFIGALKVDSL